MMGDLDMGDGRVAGGNLPAVVQSGVEKAIGAQHSAVTHYVQRLRRARPAATPAEIIEVLEKQYLAAVTAAGAAIGGAAAVPGAGTSFAFALSAGETAVFLETTALFTLAVAEVHAIRVDEIERRRTLVLTVVLGDGGAMLVDKVAGRTGEHWGKLLTDLMPMSSLSAINKTLCHWFVTHYPRKHGAMVIGKLLPFGIGAGIGAAGNHAFGRMVVSASRRVFGAPPDSFEDHFAGDIDGGFEGDMVTIVDQPREAVAPSPRVPEPTAHDLTAPEPTAPQPTVSEPTVSEPTVSEPTAPPEPTPAPPATPDQGKEPVTGKYRPLFDYLASSGADRVEISFSDIDVLVTGGLPKSASTRTWWGNTRSSRQAKAWLTAGFDVMGVDLVSRTVRFEKRSRTS
jgi:hypothetical protein